MHINPNLQIKYKKDLSYNIRIYIYYPENHERVYILEITLT